MKVDGETESLLSSETLREKRATGREEQRRTMCPCAPVSLPPSEETMVVVVFVAAVITPPPSVYPQTPMEHRESASASSRSRPEFPSN